jgi:ABC-type transport system, involved in lipoprotein release, permease component
VRQLLTESLVLATAALVVGLAIAYILLLFGIAGAVTAAHIIRSLLYDLSPFDPIAYVTVGAVLTIVAIAATILPARQALRIDPAAALRAE